MQYRKGLHKQYRHKVETYPVSKIGPLSAQFYCLLGASMTHQAPSPARWLRNHAPMKDSFTTCNTKTLWLWAHVDPRIVHVDWQPIYFSCCFCTWPRNSTWQNACHIGKGDRLAILSAKSKRILREHLRSSNPDATRIQFFFFIFYKNINYLFVHWKRLARRFQWTQKKQLVRF